MNTFQPAITILPTASANEPFLDPGRRFLGMSRNGDSLFGHTIQNFRNAELGLVAKPPFGAISGTGYEITIVQDQAVNVAVLVIGAGNLLTWNNAELVAVAIIEHLYFVLELPPFPSSALSGTCAAYGNPVPHDPVLLQYNQSLAGKIFAVR